MFNHHCWLFKNAMISVKFLWAHTLISFVAEHLGVRTNLIYDPLKKNKQSFSVHILVVTAWLCLLNGQIYLTFHETRQLSRKWHFWLYKLKKGKKKPTTFLFNLKFLQSKDLNLVFLCVRTHVWLWLGTPGFSCEVLLQSITVSFWTWGA